MKRCFFFCGELPAAQRGCSQRGPMMGSIGVTDAGGRGGSADAYISAGWILGNRTLEFLPAAEAACTETLQISGDGLGTAAPQPAAGPKQDQKHETTSLLRRWMCCFFYCITAETCSIINRGHLWQREKLLACPSGASEGADEVVE